MEVLRQPQRRALPRGQTVAELLDLTAAEARVVALLASGTRLPDIGAILKISYNTVRTLLARALAKTQTTSQVNLVRLVLSISHGVAPGLPLR